MAIRVALAALALTLSTFPGITNARDASAGPRITGATVSALTRWLSAIDHHAPRARDEALAYAWDLTVDERADLNDGIGFFFAALMGDELKIRSPFEERLAALGRGRGNAQRFLRRATLFHTDAAVERPAGRWAPAAPAGSKGRSIDPLSPLFRSGRAFIDNDGEYSGRSEKDWNWSFARYLIELSTPRPADDRFAADWYHATAGLMLLAGNYAEAAAHLKRAAVLLPNDPRILFDRACLSEVYGLPITQQMLSDDDIVALRQGRTGALSTFARESRIPLPEVANEEAERLFRRAIAIDSSLVEAGVRLGRLLLLRRRYADADTQLAAAISGGGDRIVTFYAHLFAGRANRGLGRLDAAARHYHAALELFPNAQSAVLGASQVALLEGDVSGAVTPVQRLWRVSPAPDDKADPWWSYSFSSGREGESRLNKLWDTIGQQ